jgi:hypothetical protein
VVGVGLVAGLVVAALLAAGVMVGKGAIAVVAVAGLAGLVAWGADLAVGSTADGPLVGVTSSPHAASASVNASNIRIASTLKFCLSRVLFRSPIIVFTPYGLLLYGATGPITGSVFSNSYNI